jgi:glycosyltransferase involved in cell wall biosynthesis
VPFFEPVTVNILIVYPSRIPVTYYGGTERVIWYLGQELVRMGHHVSYLAGVGSACSFAKTYIIDPGKSWNEQIPDDTDIIHFNFQPEEDIDKPFIVTMHGNRNDLNAFDFNTVFVSKSHALQYYSDSFVYNGLDWSDYSKPDMNRKRKYFHFLGNAAWRIKNVKGAIGVASKANEKLAVLGGRRLNFRMGFRVTLNPSVTFYGQVGGTQKDQLINDSKGLIFPVRWHEPFGLAIIESLYFGCPVFGTPYGALPELVSSEVGFLSTHTHELSGAVTRVEDFSAARCYQYAADQFSSHKMALEYMSRYERILNGEKLNSEKPRRKELQKEKFLPFD